MGEEQKARLLSYKKRRERRIMVTAIIVAFFTILSVISFAIYNKKDEVYYVEYKETSNVDYRVNLIENEFFDEPTLGKDHAYVAALIDTIEADINYKMKVARPDVEYQYSYAADMRLLITAAKNDKTVLEKVYELAEEKTYVQPKGQDLVLSESVVIDYNEYNDIAEWFTKECDLGDAVTCMIKVNMYVKVTGKCQDMGSSNLESYTVTLNIPLTNKLTNIEITSNIPETETKMLTCLNESSNKEAFKYAGIAYVALDVFAICVLIFLVVKTRNTYMNFTRKVSKLVSNYRTYIQKIKGELDLSGSRIIEVTTFVEMLEIRDTIQKPILMLEDADKTWAKFIIPAETNLAYVFEMKMEDFDDEIREKEEADS